MSRVAKTVAMLALFALFIRLGWSELDWYLAQQAGNEKELSSYLKSRPKGLHAGHAREALEEIHWEKAEAANHPDDIRLFLATHPDGRHADQARQQLTDMLSDDTPFLNAKAANSVPALKEFLRQNPGHARQIEALAEIENLQWKKAADAGTLASLNEFLAVYPNGRYSYAARKELAKLLSDDTPFLQARDAQSVAALEEFQKKYPGHVRQADAAALRERLIVGRNLSLVAPSPYQAMLDKAVEDIAGLQQSGFQIPTAFQSELSRTRPETDWRNRNLLSLDIEPSGNRMPHVHVSTMDRALVFAVAGGTLHTVESGNNGISVQVKTPVSIRGDDAALLVKYENLCAVRKDLADSDITGGTRSARSILGLSGEHGYDVRFALQLPSGEIHPLHPSGNSFVGVDDLPPPLASFLRECNKPASLSGPPRTTGSAAAKPGNQALLAKVAAESPNANTSRAAVNQLTDPSYLARVAVEASSPDARTAAVEKLSPGRQDVLARIAVSDRDPAVRRASVKKLTDPAMLLTVGMQSKDPDVRRAAMDKLSEQGSLAKAGGAPGGWLAVATAAIGKVTNQDWLCQWAGTAAQAAIRQAAVRGITNEKFLTQQLKTESSASVRATIIETLHGNEALRNVALTAYHEADRVQALGRLKTAAPETASMVTTALANLDRQTRALDSETDDTRLMTLTLEGPFDVLQTTAARRLSNAESVENTVGRATDRNVQKILLEKLQDYPALSRVAETAPNPVLRLAASQKAGARTWKEIFKTASDQDESARMLGDALAAVSLSPTVQPDARESVQSACLKLIRLGDESRIPEMVDLLEGYGDMRLAEDYLNCGQPDLDKTARRWAGRRGFPVSTGGGSSRARWGVAN